ncbi:hypothetical protein Tco_0925985 [Tanacetum coccineum]|uniref:Uncharacterized protein n=1 Tax=Tanacetum coccineum TaxID=301880 RepID=A0ABQ5DBG2_9ASTR
MSSPPDFQTNNNTSIVSGVYDAQLAPPPEIEGRENTSELGLADNWSEVNAVPDAEGVVHDNPSGANLSSQTTSYKSAPGYTYIVPKNTSEVDEESANTTSDKLAPGYTGISPKNPSEIDEESANNTPVNPKDVIGRRIRHVNLTEYYVKKN